MRNVSWNVIRSTRSIVLEYDININWNHKIINDDDVKIEKNMAAGRHKS